MTIELATATIKVLNEARIKFQHDPFEKAEDLFSFANEKELLKQLYYIYKGLAPANTKLKQDKYQWSNLKSAMIKDAAENPDLLESLSHDFLDYYVNYATKALLISKISSPVVSDKIIAIKSTILDSSILKNDELLESTVSPLNLLSSQKETSGNFVFLFHESSESFSQETPSDDLLSSAGKQLKNQLRLSKRTLVQGFHKLITTPSHIIFLVDQATLIRNETPADKVKSMIALLNSILKQEILSEKQSFIYFFPSIEQLYVDTNAGEVWSGYFTTSSGAKFINNAKARGYDLRKDPFQQGGEMAEHASLSFTKLEIGWSNIAGEPSYFLNGSSEMFNNPTTSLPSVSVSFGTEHEKQADFLKEVLTYGQW